MKSFKDLNKYTKSLYTIVFFRMLREAVILYAVITAVLAQGPPGPPGSPGNPGLPGVCSGSCSGGGGVSLLFLYT